MLSTTSLQTPRRTALHYAAMAGYTDCLAQLLAYGATSVPDAAGRSPLMWALDQEVPQHEAAQALLASDPTCDPNQADTDGRTCLHHIARRGDAESVSILAHAKGVNFGARDNPGLTPLHIATLAGAVECVAQLAAEGALNKKSRDMSGATALHLAVKTEDPTLRLALVDVLASMHGTDLSEEDGTGCTALHTAAASGDTSVMMLLMNHGCDRDAPDRSNEATPLMFAAKAGQLAAVQLLVR
jgi:ankyrin repeat protein